MKWYHVSFSSLELNVLDDQKFIGEFIQVIHKLKHPPDLVLYDLKFKLDEGFVFYLSCPIPFENELKNILSSYTVQPVSRPNLNVLHIVAGKTTDS